MSTKYSALIIFIKYEYNIKLTMNSSVKKINKLITKMYLIYYKELIC